MCGKQNWEAATGATHIYSLLKDMSSGALKRNITIKDNHESEGDFGGRCRVGR